MTPPTPAPPPPDLMEIRDDEANLRKLFPKLIARIEREARQPYEDALRELVKMVDGWRPVVEPTSAIAELADKARSLLTGRDQGQLAPPSAAPLLSDTEAARDE